MTTVFEELKTSGHKIAQKDAPDGLFGLEMELETPDEDSYPMKYRKSLCSSPSGRLTSDLLPEFYIDADGSLSNYGREFIFKEPLSYDDACKAVDNFAEVMKGVPFIDNAPNASTHVHINQMTKSLTQVGNFIMLYILTENLLARYAGPNRWSNFFALTFRDSELYIDDLCHWFGSAARGKIVKLDMNSTKYSGLNFARFYQIGSLEVRLMRSTADPKILKEWLGILNCLVKMAKTEGLTPPKIFSLMVNGPISMLTSIFDEDSFNALTARLDESQITKMIKSTHLTALRFEKCVADWSDIDQSFTHFKKHQEEAAGEDWHKSLYHIQNDNLAPQPDVAHWTPPVNQAMQALNNDVIVSMNPQFHVVYGDSCTMSMVRQNEVFNNGQSVAVVFHSSDESSYRKVFIKTPLHPNWTSVQSFKGLINKLIGWCSIDLWRSIQGYVFFTSHQRNTIEYYIMEVLAWPGDHELDGDTINAAFAAKISYDVWPPLLKEKILAAANAAKLAEEAEESEDD